MTIFLAQCVWERRRCIYTMSLRREVRFMLTHLIGNKPVLQAVFKNISESPLDLRSY